MGWLSEMSSRVGGNTKNSNTLPMDKKASRKLGIISFETAKIMSRVASLYKAVSDIEMHRLRNEVMRSDGIAYLNSKDEGFLYSLACAERLEDLDKAATAVGRLGQKCKAFGLKRFDLVYADLKLGVINFDKLDYGSKETEKRVEKMEKLIAATSSLYTASEALSELEISEKKLLEWKKKAPMQLQKVNFNLFQQKLDYQKKQVKHFRENSLWSKTFDKSVSLMAHAICIIYARICNSFGPHVPMLPLLSLRSLPPSKHKDIFWIQSEFQLIDPKKEQMCPFPRPIQANLKPSLVPLDDKLGDKKVSHKNRVFHAAGPSTVGGSGLAIRFANVILLVNKYFDSNVSIDHQDRGDLYQMLPENLKFLVRSKLRKNMRCNDEDESLAEGWREALNEIMRWLVPMAHDTIKWQIERNVEKMKFDSKPSILLLQTLHFADKVKTEATIAEVLVGLSCIYRYENHKS